MLDSKYSKFLTILLVVIIVGIIGLIAYVGINAIIDYNKNNDAEKFVEQYAENIGDGNNEDEENGENPFDDIESVDTTGSKKYTYKGFPVSGTIEIPKTKIKYPVLEKVSNKALEVAVAIQIGPGLNQVGNTVIVGHNYRNKLFFSKNDKINNGDPIYITDNDGNRVKYIVYNKYYTTPEDTEYMLRDTNGKREISLSTCNRDSSKRLIIWAVAEEDKE